MKITVLLFIIIGIVSSVPCYTQELSVKKIAEFEEYQGHFHLTGNGFVSVSDGKIFTYHIWDEEQNNFKKTDHT